MLNNNYIINRFELLTVCMVHIRSSFDVEICKLKYVMVLLTFM